MLREGHLKESASGGRLDFRSPHFNGTLISKLQKEGDPPKLRPQAVSELSVDKPN